MDSHGPCDPSVRQPLTLYQCSLVFRVKSMIASHFTLGQQMLECDESAGMLLACDSEQLETDDQSHDK